MAKQQKPEEKGQTNVDLAADANAKVVNNENHKTVASGRAFLELEKRETSDEDSTKERTSSESQIVYKREFRQFLREHPGVIQTFETAVEMLDKEYAAKRGREVEDDGEISAEAGTVEMNGVRVTLFTDQIGREHRFHKVDIDGRSFFVKKKSAEYKHSDVGYEQAKATEHLRNVLKDFSGVKVIDAQLGFSGKKGSYFVSDWYGGLRSLAYYSKAKKNIDRAESQRIEERWDQVEDILHKEGLQYGYFNTFYDPSTDTILLYDVSWKPDVIKK